MGWFEGGGACLALSETFQEGLRGKKTLFLLSQCAIPISLAQWSCSFVVRCLFNFDMAGPLCAATVQLHAQQT